MGWVGNYDMLWELIYMKYKLPTSELHDKSFKIISTVSSASRCTSLIFQLLGVKLQSACMGHTSHTSVP